MSCCVSFEKMIDETLHLTTNDKSKLKQQSQRVSEDVLKVIGSKCEQLESSLRGVELAEGLTEAKNWLVNFKEMITSQSTYGDCQSLGDLEILFKVRFKFAETRK